LERSLEDYRTEKSDDKELLKKLEIFKPLLNDNAITHQVWLRDPALITTLKAKAIQWYGTGVDANSKDKIIAKNARNIIETIVEECIRYGILTVPQLMHGILKNKK